EPRDLSAAATDLDRDLAPTHHEELVAVLALLDHRLARRVETCGRALREPMPRFVRQRAEEVDPSQRVVAIVHLRLALVREALLGDVVHADDPLRHRRLDPEALQRVPEALSHEPADVLAHGEITDEEPDV